jgi:hypothetical protein
LKLHRCGDLKYAGYIPKVVGVAARRQERETPGA